MYAKNIQIVRFATLFSYRSPSLLPPTLNEKSVKDGCRELVVRKPFTADSLLNSRAYVIVVLCRPDDGKIIL